MFSPAVSAALSGEHGRRRCCRSCGTPGCSGCLHPSSQLAYCRSLGRRQTGVTGWRRGRWRQAPRLTGGSRPATACRACHCGRSPRRPFGSQHCIADSVSAFTGGRPAAADSVLRSAFAEADEDGSGELDGPEVGGLLRRMGFPEAEIDIELVMGQVDADGNGTVEYEEFAPWFFGRVRPHPPAHSNSSPPAAAAAAAAAAARQPAGQNSA